MDADLQAFQQDLQALIETYRTQKGKKISLRPRRIYLTALEFYSAVNETEIDPKVLEMPFIFTIEPVEVSNGATE